MLIRVGKNLSYRIRKEKYECNRNIQDPIECDRISCIEAAWARRA